MVQPPPPSPLLTAANSTAATADPSRVVCTVDNAVAARSADSAAASVDAYLAPPSPSPSSIQNPQLISAHALKVARLHRRVTLLCKIVRKRLAVTRASPPVDVRASLPNERSSVVPRGLDVRGSANATLLLTDAHQLRTAAMGCRFRHRHVFAGVCEGRTVIEGKRREQQFRCTIGRSILRTLLVAFPPIPRWRDDGSRKGSRRRTGSDLAIYFLDWGETTTAAAMLRTIRSPESVP